MNLIDKIKKIFNLKTKLLDKPIEEMTVEEKYDLTLELLKDKNYSENTEEKILRIIDSMPTNAHKDNLALIIKFSKLKNDEIEKRAEKIYERYNLERKDKERIKEEMFLNSDSSVKLLEKYINELNTSELNALLCSHSINKSELLEIAVQKGRKDLSEENLRDYFTIVNSSNSSIIEHFDLFKKLKVDSQEMILRRKSNETLDKFIEDFDEVDKTFYKILTGTLGLKEKIDIDLAYNLIMKYNENIRDYYEITNHYTVDEINALKQRIEDTQIPEKDEKKFENVKSYFNIKDKTEEEKADDQIIQQYFSIKGDEEKRKAFNNIKEEVILRNIYYFIDELTKAEKEDVIKRFAGKKDSIKLTELRKFTNDEIVKILGENKENYSNLDLLNLRERGDFDKGFYQLFNLNDFKKMNFQMMYLTKIINTKEGFDLVVKFLQNYEEKIKSENEKNSESLEGGIRKLSKEQVIHMYNENPNLLKYVDFYKFNNEDLLSLYEIGKNSEQYCRRLLEISNQLENFDEEKKVETISNCIEKGFFKDEKDCRYLEINTEVFKKVFERLDDQEKEKFLSCEFTKEFFNKIIYKTNDNEIDKILDNLIKIIDPEEKVLYMYKTINKENMEKYREKSKIDGGYISQITGFFQSLGKILHDKDTLFNMVKEDSTLFISLNYKLLDILDGKKLEFFSKYKEMQNIYINDGEKLNELLRKTVESISDKLDYPEKYIKKCIEIGGKISNDQANILLEKMNIDQIIYFACKKPELIKGCGKECENILGFKEANEKYCDNIMNDPNSSLEKIQEAYTKRFLGMEYFEAKKFIQMYEQGLNTLLKRYNKSDLSQDELAEYNSLKKLQFLKELLTMEDKDILRESYFEFIENKELNFNYSIEDLMIEEKIKEAYTKEKIENLYKPNEEDLYKIEKVNSKDVKIYKTTQFNILITVVGAYIKNINAKNNPKEDWNDKEKNVNHEICTSLISNQNLSMAINRKALKYGFYKISSGSIEKERCRDIASRANQIDAKSIFDSEYRTTNDMIDNIRTGHSEHLLERRLKDGSNEKRQPDYIIAIDKVTKEDLKAASEFDIPIVLLDSNEIAKSEFEEINTIKERLEQDISIEDLKELIVRYHNNYTGLFNINKRALRKYFNPKEMCKYASKLVDKIESISDEQERIKVAKVYLSEIEKEEKKRVDVQQKFIPFRFDDIKGKLMKYKDMEETSTEDNWKKQLKYEVKAPSAEIEENRNIQKEEKVK